MFSLGYYHQRAHDRAQAKEARAARDARGWQPARRAVQTTKTPLRAYS